VSLSGLAVGGCGCEADSMAGGSSEQDLSALYRRYIACCNAHEFHRLAEFVASAVQVNGDVQSLPDYIRNLEAAVEAFPDYHWDLQHLLVDGEWVAAHLIDTGTHLGTFLGVQPTGREVTTQELAFYRVAADRIVEVWVTADNLRVLQQLR
jgi:predicted ester cyclase